MEQVADQARRRPAHTAVRYRDARLTYGELDARSNRIARELLARGVAPGDRVVTCLEPELDVPAVLLAILKVGAAYVPVDPNYPAVRIAVMVTDVAPSLVVTRRALMRRIGVDFPGALLALDEAVGAVAAREPTAPDILPDLGRIATIFHTSGTTGRPKGARATHANVAFFARAARERYAIAPTDVVPVIARFTFSISMFEVVVPLTAGATILILDRDHVMDARRMARTFAEITFFHAGPSLLRGILAAIREEQAPERYARVRHASSGGDMVPPQVLAEMRELFPRAEIFVVYGCSEISCMGCTDELPREGALERTYVGRPFPDTSVRLLDATLKPVPVGEVGEVWFSGPGVIAGYLDRPDLDEEKFVEIEERRYYRTGDVGRWWDGRGLELLGRTDFQVKVRGMRVECAEVEFHIRQVPGIRDGAVVGRERRGERVLAAFIVRDFTVASVRDVDVTALAAAVRRQLSTAVPDYMVPSAIVELDALPLNHNLKLDRNALPELAADLPPAEADQAPRTETERWLAATWRELLGCGEVGRRQNFFELGGDSLLAMQVIARAEAELDARLEGMTLLRESLADIARVCDRQRSEVGDAPTFVEAEDPPPRYGLTGFHFGPAASLYGLLYAPVERRGSRAVLICGPVGSDDVRPHFVLSLLARRLAEAGVPAMRFDYFGTRDSLGEEHEGDPARWTEDILAARAELLARTGASEVTAIGVRMGATLLLQTAEASKWARLVAWDPVIDGSAHCARLTAMHERSVERYQSLRPWRRPWIVAGREERLGFVFSAAAFDAMRRTGVGRSPAALSKPPVAWLATSDRLEQRSAYVAFAQGAGGAAFMEAPFEAAWDDRRRVGELMPDSGIVRSLLALAEPS